jgi:serine/threonine-protein kinase
MAVLDRFQPGDRIGGFQLEKELGRGGMGVVYKAHELSLNRKVALKIISERLADDEEFLSRFRREAQVIARLDHPNIVRILSYGEADGLSYFAMEYISGGDLGRMLQQKGTLSLEQALSFGSQIAGALAEAEAQGVVHRDLKPSNIMIDSLGRAKVTDFGVAHLQDAATQLTKTGLFLGSPEYASPEQATGKPLDIRSDIYALGAILYRSLSGQPPVSGDSPLAMITKIVTEPLIPIGEVNPALPAPVCRLIDTMMAKDPAGRYEHPNEVIEAIDRCIAELKMDVPLTGRKHVPLAAAAASRPEPKPRLVKIAGGIAGLALSILIVFWLVDAGLQKKATTPDREQDTELQAQANQEPPAATESPRGSKEQPAVSAETQTAPHAEAELPKEEKAPAAEEPSSAREASDTAREPSGGSSGSAALSQEGDTAQEHADAEAGAIHPAKDPSPQDKPLRQQASLERPPPLPEVPTVIMAVWGEQVVVPDLKANLENALFSSGLKVASVSEIPVLRRRVQLGDTPISWYAVRQVVPQDLGHILLLAEVQKVGSMRLEYYGRTQELITSSFTVRAVDMNTGTAVAPSLSGTVKYTALNAQEKLKQALLPEARRLGRQIKSFWREKRKQADRQG